MSKILKNVINPFTGIYWLIEKLHITYFIPDKIYLKIMFHSIMGKKLNLKYPKTFNEKLQWLKIYDHKLEYVRMVDKYEVKKFIADILGEEYLIPTLGIWENFDDIDFEMLPNQFVLKCTHNSGGVVICKDKSNLDINSTRREINKSLNSNFYWYGREWPYKNVRRRIIAEKYVVPENSCELRDYKFMVFNGQVKCSFVCSERYSRDGLKLDFFDNNWNHMPVERYYKNSTNKIDRPHYLHEMTKISEKIARNINVAFVRVDLYETKDQIYFGEITFFPGSGYEKFSPEKWDYTFGSWIKLPKQVHV